VSILVSARRDLARRDSAQELVAMIIADLRQVEGCPKEGVTVSVSLLMFGAAAGPVRNRAELKQFFNIIVERLQRLYDAIV
jgi:hypothetical protein